MHARYIPPGPTAVILIVSIRLSCNSEGILILLQCIASSPLEKEVFNSFQNHTQGWKKLLAIRTAHTYNSIWMCCNFEI